MASYCLRSPQLTKFSEGHVYSHVCLPFCLTVHTGGGLHVTITRYVIGGIGHMGTYPHQTETPPIPGLVHMDLTLHLHTHTHTHTPSPHRDPSAHPRRHFQIVHCVARIVGKRAGATKLKCLLVYFIVFHVVTNKYRLTCFFSAQETL